MPGEQPIEQRRARSADVEIARRRRSEANAWFFRRRHVREIPSGLETNHLIGTARQNRASALSDFARNRASV